MGKICLIKNNFITSKFFFKLFRYYLLFNAKLNNLFLFINHFKKPKFFEFKNFIKYFIKRKKFKIKSFSNINRKKFNKFNFLRFILFRFIKFNLFYKIKYKLKKKKSKKDISYYLWPFYKTNESIFFLNYMFKNIINLFFF